MTTDEDQPYENLTVHCNLSTHMGRRRLRIADVARGTGLHQNVVSRYYHDQAQRYDKDVLEALCKFFKISPGELIVLEAPDSFPIEDSPNP